MNTYCFSIPTVVARMRLSVTLQVQRLFCLFPTCIIMPDCRKLTIIVSLDIIGVKFLVITMLVLRLREHQSKAGLMHILLVILPHRTTFSDLHVGYGGLEIKSQGDECVFCRCGYQFHTRYMSRSNTTIYYTKLSQNAL